MNELLLSVHVVAGIVFVGPITVAASLFPRYGREALSNADGAVPVARILHRITRSYTVLAITVPLLGIVLAARMGVLFELWVLASLAITLIAAVLLVGVVVPSQTRLMVIINGGPAPPSAATAAVAPVVPRALRRLSMATGVFSLLWVVVVVLMIVRPGSTTGI